MKPLTVEELKALKVGDWVWIECNNESGYIKVQNSFDNEFFYAYGMYAYADYGIKWIAYKNKEQAEEYKESLNNVKEMLSDCCCECTRYEINLDKLKGKK